MRHFVRLDDSGHVEAVIALPDDYPFLVMSDGTPLTDLHPVSEKSFLKYMWLLIIAKPVRWHGDLFPAVTNEP